MRWWQTIRRMKQAVRLSRRPATEYNTSAEEGEASELERVMETNEETRQLARH